MTYIILLFSFGYSQNPDNDAALRLAQSFESASEYERALMVYESLLQKDSLNYTIFDGARRCYVQLKRYQEALTLSDLRLNRTPYDFNLQASIGSIFAVAGEELKADSVWNRIIQQGATNQMYYRAVANEQATQRMFDKALETYRMGRSKIGDPYLFANELGYYYTFMMDYPNATREYLLLLKQNEQQLEFVQSRLAQFIGKPNGQTAVLEVISNEIEKTPQNISMRRILLWAQMEGKDFESAFGTAQSIERQLNANGAEAFSFAERAFREGAYSVASKAYAVAIQQGKTMQFVPSAKFGYARCAEEQLYDSAQNAGVNPSSGSTISETQSGSIPPIALYESLVRDYPYSTVALNALLRIGSVRAQFLFDLDGAIAVFDSVTRISPMSSFTPQAFLWLGELKTKKGEIAEAHQKYRSVLIVRTSTPQQQTLAKFRIAQLAYYEGKFDTALTVLNSLLENVKSDEANDAIQLQVLISEHKENEADALRLLANAELLDTQRKKIEAVTVLKDLINRYPNSSLNEQAMMEISEMLISTGRFTDAFANYRAILKQFPESVNRDKIQFLTGDLLQSYLKDIPAAIIQYQSLLEQYPSSIYTEEARKRIRQLRGDVL